MIHANLSQKNLLYLKNERIDSKIFPENVKIEKNFMSFANFKIDKFVKNFLISILKIIKKVL